MAQAAIFVSPRYNVGEKVAGGSIAIYTDNSQQQLVPLWRYADLKVNTSDGSGAISNPVPIDNNGILSSPIFYDSSQDTGYVNAYYVLRDAYGAIVRQGFVTPQSWQLTGNPIPPDNPWANTPAGDPYWGYEVIKGTTLVNTPGTIGRPLYYQPASGADRSGGLIVYFVPGNAISVDNVLSFQGQGGVWVSRDEWINYSYLKAVLPAATEPFAWLNTNYGTGIYAKNMNLDAEPKSSGIASGTVRFNNKIRILNGLTFTPSTSLTTIVIDEDRLDFLQTGPAFTQALNSSGDFPLTFQVRGGSFSASKIELKLLYTNYYTYNATLAVSGTLDNLDLDGFTQPIFRMLSGSVVKNLINTGATQLNISYATLLNTVDIWRCDANVFNNTSTVSAPIGLSSFLNCKIRMLNILPGTAWYFNANNMQGATIPLCVTTDQTGIAPAVVAITDTTKSANTDYNPTVLDVPVAADYSLMPGERACFHFGYAVSPSDARAFAQNAIEYFIPGTQPGLNINSTTGNNGSYVSTNAFKLSPSKLSTFNVAKQIGTGFSTAPMMNETLSEATMTTNGSLTGATWGFSNIPSILRNNYNNPGALAVNSQIIMANSRLLDIEGDGKTVMLLKSVRKAKKCIFICEVTSGSNFGHIQNEIYTWSPWADTRGLNTDSRILMRINADSIEDSIILLDKLSYPVQSRITYRHAFKNTKFKNCVFLGNHSNLLLENCVAENCSFQQVETLLTDSTYSNFHVLLGSGTTVSKSYTNGVIWELYGDGDGDTFRDIDLDLTSIDSQIVTSGAALVGNNCSMLMFLWTGGVGATGCGMESGQPINNGQHGKFNSNPCKVTNVRLNANQSTCTKNTSGTAASRIAFESCGNIGMSNWNLDSLSYYNVTNYLNIRDYLSNSGGAFSFIVGGADLNGHWAVNGHDGVPTQVYPGVTKTNGDIEWSSGNVNSANQNQLLVESSVAISSSNQDNLAMICMPVISESLVYMSSPRYSMNSDFYATMRSDNSDIEKYSIGPPGGSGSTYPLRNRLRTSKYAYWLSPANRTCFGVPTILYKIGGTYQTGGN